MIVLKTEEDLRYMRKAGRIVADVLDLIAGIVRPGITTADIDRAAEELMTKESATPAFKGYRVPGIPVAFPGAVCASINEEIVHGIPTQERYLACTFPVGQVSLERQTLINVTLESLNRAVSVAKDGNTIGDIGYAVESYVVPKGFGLVRDYTGHGVGKHLHEPPQVPNFGRPGRGVTLKAGMTIAIEPMVMSGAEDTVVGPDRWVVLTADGSDAAHFERSVLITKDGAEVLTPWEWA